MSELVQWRADALNAVRHFPKARFQAEEVRAWAYAGGLEHPDNEKSWGAVMRAAKGEGLIAHSGYHKVSNIKAHGTPAGVWDRVTV
jgi:hypothetical protein